MKLIAKTDIGLVRATNEDTYTFIKGKSKNLFDSAGRVSVYNSNAVEENYSINEDGSINIPVALRPYMGNKEKIELKK